MEEKTGEELLRLSEELVEREPEAIADMQAHFDELAASLTASDEERQTLYTKLYGKAKTMKAAAKNLRRVQKKLSKASDELDTRITEVKRLRSPVVKRLAPINSLIDHEEKKRDSFAKGINLYKLAIVCFLGSIIGVLFEMFWCLLVEGHVESRAGMVYGPFNFLYGVGAVAMTLVLYRFRNRSWVFAFFGGALSGTLVEYSFSWLQELLFRSRSWDYTGMPLNIDGRVCLLYSVMWGLLGIAWIKVIYPVVARLILLLPNILGRIAAVLMILFLAFNGIMTSAAVDRWNERREGVAPENGFDVILDEWFPDERMQEIYVDMTFE